MKSVTIPDSNRKLRFAFHDLNYLTAVFLILMVYIFLALDLDCSSGAEPPSLPGFD